MPIETLYSSPRLVVVNKASASLSVPGRFEDSRPIVGIELQKELGKQIYPVHRLDFEVSGVLIFALDPNTHKILNTAFESGAVKKTYQAFTEMSKTAGTFPPGVIQKWQSKIVRGKKRSFFAEYGKESLTSGKLEKIHPKNICEWTLEPHTGRPHQLRLELSSRGFPILGDKLYGSTFEAAPDTIHLRCIEISLGALSDPELSKLVFRAAHLQLP